MAVTTQKPKDDDGLVVPKSFWDAWDATASRILFVYVANVLVLVVGAAFFLPESGVHLFPRNMLDVGVDSGMIMGTFLIIKGWFTRRGEVASGCFFVAGFIMLAEAGYLIYADYYLRTQR